jgi:hypothetical protein
MRYQRHSKKTSIMVSHRLSTPSISAGRPPPAPSPCSILDVQIAATFLAHRFPFKLHNATHIGVGSSNRLPLIRNRLYIRHSVKVTQPGTETSFLPFPHPANHVFRLYIRNSEQQSYCLQNFLPFEGELHACGHTPSALDFDCDLQSWAVQTLRA